ncbi:hypothetical protein [Kineobactrum salinum]|uniref:Uncharacterized protein n=1 Tax=Kineobactrum salinum TaxID=2708301 RepID=A0A6C0U2Q6_9GAMM|nr:hypothetical protein [Kineobactrum salinum]QIB66452.1 hypothetical protein G3T16_14645 [Kineobactrum salinum]
MRNSIAGTIIAGGLTAALTVAVQTATAQAAADSEKPRDRRCLSISRIDRIETVDNQTLIFHMHGDEKYINHLPYRCSGLKHNSFLHETSLNSYCDLDIISVVDTSLGMRLGSCPLGPFEPYTEAASNSNEEQQKQ